MRAAPDGHTLLMGSTSTMITAPMLQATKSYAAGSDFQPIALMFKTSGMLIVPANSKYITIADLVADMRDRPGKVFYSSAGAGTFRFVVTERMPHAANVQATHVPYPRPSESRNAVIGGEVGFTIEVMQTALPLIEAGRARLPIWERNDFPRHPTSPRWRKPGFLYRASCDSHCSHRRERLPRSSASSGNKSPRTSVKKTSLTASTRVGSSPHRAMPQTCSRRSRAMWRAGARSSSPSTPSSRQPAIFNLLTTLYTK